MNTESKDTLNIAITGVLTIGREELERLLARFVPVSPAPSSPSLKPPDRHDKPGRMSYSVKETAELLGVSASTVYRLLERGLLRSSLAIRTKVIPKSEIERFLAETSQSCF